MQVTGLSFQGGLYVAEITSLQRNIADLQQVQERLDAETKEAADVHAGLARRVKQLEESRDGMQCTLKKVKVRRSRARICSAS
jgi:FtsZ-binding cell division protein ZapB